MAPTKHTIAALMGLISTTNGQAISGQTANQCLTAGNQYTLMNTVSTSSTAPNFALGGTCCTSSANGGVFDVAATDNCITDCTETYDAFCATGATVTNRFLRDFLQPANADKCPDTSDQDVKITTTGASASITKKIEFDQTVPDSSATWACKYKISAPSLATVALDADLASRESTSSGNGWIYLEAQQVGFDKNVYVIMQPPEKYYDFNYRSQTNNPVKQSYLGVSQYGRKYVFPAEYDVFVMFQPVAYNGGSEEEPTDVGYFQFKTYHTMTDPSESGDTTWTKIDRLEALVSETTTVTNDEGEDVEVVVYTDEEVVEPVQSDDEQVAPTDDNDLPVTKIDFETNEVVSQGTKWRDETAFTIGDREVTKEEAATASGVVVALIIIIVVMCCVFSYIERKKIAEEGRRMSTAIRRASTKLRRGSNAPPEKEMTDKDIERAAASVAGNKNERNFLEDQMKAQRDADPMASQASMADNANPQPNTNSKMNGEEGAQDQGYKDPVE